MEEDEVVHVPIEEALDLHPFAPRDVIAVVDDYLEAACGAGFEVIRLIHGRGMGVQRAAIHRHLRAHALVETFWDAAESHLGATVVKLKK
jgi:dsDNA-specific endonuclease/ATPase MutS2